MTNSSRLSTLLDSTLDAIYEIKRFGSASKFHEFCDSTAQDGMATKTSRLDISTNTTGNLPDYSTKILYKYKYKFSTNTAGNLPDSSTSKPIYEIGKP